MQGEIYIVVGGFMKEKRKNIIKIIIFKTFLFLIAICLAALTVRVLTNNVDGRRQIVDEDGGQEVHKSLLVPARDGMEEFEYE